AWTYNGRIPGPTLRCREGERLRIAFGNGSSHPHTIHFHGIHPAEMDGVPGIGAGEVAPGGRTVYEFDALPAGLHLSHTRARPLSPTPTPRSGLSPSTSPRACTAPSSSTPRTAGPTPTRWSWS